MKKIVFLYSTFLMCINFLQAKETSPTADYHKSMAQLYRWYQYYENNNIPISNQLDIFDEGIIITNPTGSAEGKDKYTIRIEDLPKTWKNSHQIQKSALKRINSNTLELSVEIIYQNIGMQENNKISAYKINYTTLLKEGKTSLPKFSKITLMPSQEKLEDIYYNNFKDIYVENRVKSLVHYWLYLIEFNKKDSTYFKEILVKNGLDINFTTTKIKDFKGFEQWYNQTAQKVLSSSHVIDTFKITSVKGNEYSVEMEFDWVGYTQDNPKVLLEARTLHKWVVVDDPKERFARVKAVEVSMLKPFQPKK
jgi:hypothetical protein